MIYYPLDRNILDLFDDLLHYFLYLNNFWHLHSDLHYFLDYLINWNWLLNDLFCNHNFLSDQLHISIFNQGNDNFSFYLPISVNFYWSLNKPLDLYNFRYLSNNLNYFLNHLWDFDYSLFDPKNLNKFLNDQSFKYGNLYGHIYSVLDYLILFHLNRGLYSALNFNYFRDLNYSLYDFLHNFLDFDNFWSNSINFKNIINIYDIHNFLTNHADNAFIDLWDNSASAFHLLHFFK